MNLLPMPAWLLLQALPLPLIPQNNDKLMVDNEDVNQQAGALSLLFHSTDYFVPDPWTRGLM